MRAINKNDKTPGTATRRVSMPHKGSLLEKETWPATLLGGVVVSVALGYGLVAGGHVSGLSQEISKSARDAVEVAGLSIRDITITGNKRASRAAILQQAGFDVGSPIMGFKTDEVRDRLQTMDWIETAQVVRLLPDRVTIHISERQPFALWQLEGDVRVIDRSGKVLSSLSPADYPLFLQLVGKGADKEGVALISLLKKYPQLYQQVKAAVRLAERRWTLKLVQDIDLYLPEDNIGTALEEFVRLQTRYQLLGKKIKLVDMRLSEKITIRLRQERHNEDKTVSKRVPGAKTL